MRKNLFGSSPSTQKSFPELFFLPMAVASPILSSSPRLALLYPPSSASPPSCGIKCPHPQKRSPTTLQLVLGTSSSSSKLQTWRTGISFFPSFSVKKRKDPEALKKDLLDAIAPLDRGAEATDEDKERVDEVGHAPACFCLAFAVLEF